MDVLDLDSFKKAILSGKLDYLMVKWFVDILNQEEIWALQHIKYDHIAVFQYSLNHGLGLNIQFLFRHCWDDRYIEFCKNDDDYLIDIVELYPEKYRQVLPLIQNEENEAYLRKIYRKHPMKLRKRNK